MKGFRKGQLCAPGKMNLKTFTLRFELRVVFQSCGLWGKTLNITEKYFEKLDIFHLKKKRERKGMFFDFSLVQAVLLVQLSSCH